MANLGGDSYNEKYFRDLAKSQQNVTAIPRDKTQTEVLIDRLQATAQRMGTMNDNASGSLDRLNGGVPTKGDTASASPPTPTDFVGHATSLLDAIGRELERMDSNMARLSRLA